MSATPIFKRCGCRDRKTGRRLGNSCPRLRRRNGAGSWSQDHGTWHYRLELPSPTGGQRRQLRRGGFPTRAQAVAERDHITGLILLAGGRRLQACRIADAVLAAVRVRGPLPEVEDVAELLHPGRSMVGVPTVERYLTWWLGQLRVDANTVRTYHSHVRVHLIPHLGRRRLDKLTVADVTAMLAAITSSGRSGGRPGPATCERIRATLRKALNDAVAERLITFNPAAHARPRSTRRARPRLWTPDRVQAWRATGQVPSAVMVWTAEQTGAFLDHAAVHDPQLYPLLHLMAYSGLRRGEAVGLLDADVDLEQARLSVTNQIVTHGWTPHAKRPKSDTADRTIDLDVATVAVLRAHRQRQARRRAAAGPAWPDTGLLFTQPDGTPWHPGVVSRRFKHLVARAGLPPVRLHDLRHGAASLAHATGADLKDIQTLLGHSGIAITADTYTTLFPHRARTSAEAIAAAIPRRTHWPTTHRSK